MLCLVMIDTVTSMESFLANCILAAGSKQPRPDDWRRGPPHAGTVGAAVGLRSGILVMSGAVGAGAGIDPALSMMSRRVHCC